MGKQNPALHSNYNDGIGINYKSMYSKSEPIGSFFQKKCLKGSRYIKENGKQEA